MSKFAYFELLWAPHKLAKIAWRSSTAGANVVGAAFLIFELGLLVSGQATGAGEPFRDVSSYLVDVVTIGVLVGAVLSGVIVIPAGTMLFVMQRFAPAKWNPVIRVFILGHLSLFVPVVIWSFCAAIEYSSWPSFQYYGPSGKPAWVHLSVFRILSSYAWWIVGLIAYLVICLFAVRNLSRYQDADGMPRCKGCEYILKGLTEARCPECGRPFVRCVPASAGEPLKRSSKPRTEN